MADYDTPPHGFEKDDRITFQHRRFPFYTFLELQLSVKKPINESKLD